MTTKRRQKIPDNKRNCKKEEYFMATTDTCVTTKRRDITSKTLSILAKDKRDHG